MALTPSDPAYWQSAYDEGRTRWDIGDAAPAWAELLRLHPLPVGRALVLGAGRGHDALWFAARGDQVTAVDFAPSRVEASRDAANAAGLSVDVRQMDLFDLPKSGLPPFDLVIEHTCFCAIEPQRRQEYVSVVTAMTKPGGHFVGVFFWQTPPDGPPFQTSEAEIRKLFTPAFEIERLEPNPVSIPPRAGREGWGVFRRRY